MSAPAAEPLELVLRVGERHELTLQSYAGSGNRWSVSGDADQPAASIAVEVEPPPFERFTATGTEEPPTPRLAVERAVVTAGAPGEATFHLELRRDFGPPQASLVQEVRVRVLARPIR